jgi:hypothetical protein
MCRCPDAKMPDTIPTLLPFIYLYVYVYITYLYTGDHVPRIHIRPNLPQTLTNPQDAIDQEPICWPLDLKIPEEGIGTEQVQDLVQRIEGFGVGLGREMERQGGVEGKCVGWPADLST